jgi:hypothetical protein
MRKAGAQDRAGVFAGTKPDGLHPHTGLGAAVNSQRNINNSSFFAVL